MFSLIFYDIFALTISVAGEVVNVVFCRILIDERDGDFDRGNKIRRVERY